MSAYFLIILLLGAATGGFVNGLAGFGTALIALGFWLQIMPPQQAVPLVVVMSVISGLQGLWLVRHSVGAQPKRLARFFLPGIIGVPLGVAALAIIDPKLLKIAIAGLMLLYGGFFTLRRSLPKLEYPTPFMDSFVGFLGGVLGGAASLSGALPTMWCALRPWSKSETRAVLQPYNVGLLALTMAVFALQGAYTGQALKLIAITLPVTILCAQIGISIFKRLSDDQFRQLLITMMLISGLALTVKEVL